MFVFVAETYGIYLNVLNVLSFVRKTCLKFNVKDCLNYLKNTSVQLFKDKFWILIII